MVRRFVLSLREIRLRDFRSRFSDSSSMCSARRSSSSGPIDIARDIRTPGARAMASASSSSPKPSSNSSAKSGSWSSKSSKKAQAGEVTEPVGETELGETEPMPEVGELSIAIAGT